MQNSHDIVLIVDDDLISCELFKELLKGLGIKCLEVNNGHDALKVVKENANIKLVLMDIKMPGLDGIETMRRIKKIRTDLPVIAQTAYISEGITSSYKKVGFNDYLEKPIDFYIFQEVIQEYLIMNY